MTYFLMAVVLFGTVLAQILLKRGLMVVGEMPKSMVDIMPFVIKVFSNPYVLLSMLSVLITSICWIFVLIKFDLSQMYPFMGLSFVLIALFSVIFLKEQVGVWGWIGVIFISAGVFIVMRN